MTATTKKPYWDAEKLKAYRLGHGLSQKVMADRLAIRENSYGRLERGQTTITPRMSLLMSKVLGRPPKIGE